MNVDPMQAWQAFSDAAQSYLKAVSNAAGSTGNAAGNKASASDAAQRLGDFLREQFAAAAHPWQLPSMPAGFSHPDFRTARRRRHLVRLASTRNALGGFSRQASASMPLNDGCRGSGPMFCATPARSFSSNWADSRQQRPAHNLCASFMTAGLNPPRMPIRASRMARNIVRRKQSWPMRAVSGEPSSRPMLNCG